MIVVLEGEKAGEARTPREETATVKIEGFELQPPVLFVNTNTTVLFKNNGSTNHSCHAEGANGFQFSEIKPGEEREHRFLSEGVVEVHCHRFPFMKATILIGSTPLATRVDASGRFSIQQVPAGDYRVRVFAAGKWRWDSAVKVPAAGLIQIGLGPKTPAALAAPARTIETPKKEPLPEEKPPSAEKTPPPEKKPPPEEKAPPQKKPPPAKKPPPEQKPPREKRPEIIEEVEPTFKDVEPEIEIEEE